MFIDGMKVVREYQKENSEKSRHEVTLPAQPSKVITLSLSLDYAFVSLENGMICKVDPRILIKKNAHKGKIVDLQAVQDCLISAGEDGFVFLWDEELNRKSWYDFKTLIGSTPKYISYRSDQDLIVIESEEKECFYFDSNLRCIEIAKTENKSELSEVNFFYKWFSFIRELAGL